MTKTLHRLTPSMRGDLEDQMKRLRRKLFNSRGGSLLDPFQAIVQLRRINEGVFDSGDNLIHGLFARPEQQLSQLKALNVIGGWFDRSHFEQLVPPPDPVNQNHLTVVVLDIHIDSVQFTFDTAWNLVASQRAVNRYSGLLSDSLNLRANSRPGKNFLKWCIVNLGANRDLSPLKVRHTGTMAGAAILWMAFFSPRWLTAMNGKEVPFVWLPDYELRSAEIGGWQNTPALMHRAGSDVVKLECYRCFDIKPGWAVPEYLNVK